MIEIKSHIKYLRIAPRKVRLVARVVQGKSVTDAEVQLSFIKKRGAKSISKLLKAAYSGAFSNHGIDKENLFIKKITADEGPKLKRWMPRAFGRATPILKRTSHLTLILGTKGEISFQKSKVKFQKASKEKITERKEKEKILRPPEQEAKVQKGGVVKEIKRKFFRRKSI